MEPSQNASTAVGPNNVMQSSASSNELIYGGGGTNSVTGSEETHVMSEKVQMIASSIYKEFEIIIQKFGQDLMPLVVNVLENLDTALSEKDELVVDVEMLKEENEQLLNQYERERQMRKNQDQKCLEIEESYVEQLRELEGKVESMTSIVRMLELKAKNAADHASRMEEREVEQKMEYEKLHERYNELLRTHIEHVERTKFLMGAEMFDMAQSLPINPKNNRNVMAMSAIDSNVRGISDLISAVHMSQSTHGDLNLANHISNERDWHEEFGDAQTAAEILATPRDIPSKTVGQADESDGNANQDEEKNTEEKETREDGDAISLGADLTGNLVDPAEFASAVNDTFIGMGKEVENLIRENTELLETKNALNIVKNDLIARVDQLSSEQQVFREEVRSLEMVKLKLSERIRELETDLKELREKNLQEESAEEDMALRKRFTRVEMARVLMERNQYKEKLFELQEAVKFTELQRAKKSTMAASQQNKSLIWSFFSNLLGESTSPAHTRSSAHSVRKAGARKNLPSSPMTQRKTRTKTLDSDTDSKLEKYIAERKQHYRAVSAHMKQEDYPNAYGWSMASAKSAQNMSMPVPVNCRPLQERIPSLKICCAASCSLYGGLSNGEYIAGDPILGCDPYLLLQNSLQKANDSDDGAGNKTIGDLKKLNGGQFSLLESSSLVWICSSNEQKEPFITIVDVNNPGCILESFQVDVPGELLCIASVPGLRESHIRISEEGLTLNSELCSPGGYLEKERIHLEATEFETFGSVEFTQLQKEQEAAGTFPAYTSIAQQQQAISPSKRRRESSTGEVRTKESESPEHRFTNHGNVGFKPLLHRTAAIPITSGDENEAGEKEAKVNEKIEGSEESPQREDKKPSPLDSLPLHIRNTLKRYEGVSNDDLLTLPTMWIGTENEYIYIYSAVREWRKCLRRVRMPDAILSILHVNGRVFVALADGSIAMFHRDMSGQWSDLGYHLMRLGPSDASVCHLCSITSTAKIWAAYKNAVIVIDPVTARIENTFVAHPRKDSKVRQLAYYGSGVWVSIRLDSTIRLFHAGNFQHLQDVDAGAFITKMLGPNKLDLVLLRITSLSIMDRRVWIGTGSGIIISIPFSQENSTKTSGDERSNKGPGQVIRLMTADDSNQNAPHSAIIPYCEISQAQLSFHGHRDAVRFMVPVLAEGFSDLTQNTEFMKFYMVSGGDGYIDFRLGDEETAENSSDQRAIRVHDMSHLLIWESECPMDWTGRPRNATRES